MPCQEKWRYLSNYIMLKRLIRGLRRKPKIVRDNIALGMAAGVTFLVFTVWVYHMPSRMEAISERHAEDESQPIFSQLVDGVKGAFSDESPTVEETGPVQVVAPENLRLDPSMAASVSAARQNSSSTSDRYGFVKQEEVPAPREIRIVATTSASRTESSENQ